MGSVLSGVERLSESARDGRLAHLAAEFELDLVVLFGSAAVDPSSAEDLDVAVRGSSDLYLPLLVSRLMGLAETDDVDVVDLRRASTLLQVRALVDGVRLWEAAPHLHVEASIAAMTRHMDTAWLRRRQLEGLAG